MTQHKSTLKLNERMCEHSKNISNATLFLSAQGLEIESISTDYTKVRPLITLVSSHKCQKLVGWRSKVINTLNGRKSQYTTLVNDCEVNWLN